MKMRQRRRVRQAHQMLGLRIGQILADLERACDLLLDALESGDLAAAIRADETAGSETATVRDGSS